jgi:hypothetical protein
VANCDVKRQLLDDYMASLEHVKIAQREYTEILTVGTGGGAALRSSERIEVLKALSGEARARYAEHCHAHRC